MTGFQQFDLSGKSAIVTGASKGLGRAMAEGLAAAGADVLITSRNAEEAQAAALQVASAHGVRAEGVKADVTSAEDVDQMVTLALEQFGKIDILVNNAGINIRSPIDQMSHADFRRVQDVNVDGLWLCCRAVVPPMKRAGSGRIINLSSTLGLVGLEDRTAYAASKGAVAQITRVLALELAPHGILCNAICPGPFLTPMNESIANNEQTKKHIVGAVALQRWGRMEEIQGPAVFLASDAASYVTGSILCVDGGWTAR